MRSGASSRAVWHVALGGVIVLALLGGEAALRTWADPADRAAGAAAPPPPSPSVDQAPPTPSPRPTLAPPALDPSCLALEQPATGASIPAGDPFGSDVGRYGPDASIHRLYAARFSELIPLDGLGPPGPCDRALWDIVVAVDPSIVPYVDELLVFDSAPQAWAGGLRKIAEVTPKRRADGTMDMSHWRVSFSPNGLNRADTAWMIAHELAHLASLNTREVEALVDGECPALGLGGLCLSLDSYLAVFLDDHWPAAVLHDWRAAATRAGVTNRQRALATFYETHRDRFITAYAATSPLEDFAETFAMWCARTPEQILAMRLPMRAAGAKIGWFDQDPDHVPPTLAVGCQTLRLLATT